MIVKMNDDFNSFKANVFFMVQIANSYSFDSSVKVTSVDVGDKKLLNSVDENPALDIEGTMRVWTRMGKVHRTNGPAVIDIKTNDEYWYINDKDITKEFLQWAEENSIDIRNITKEDEQLILMKWDN